MSLSAVLVFVLALYLTIGLVVRLVALAVPSSNVSTIERLWTVGTAVSWGLFLYLVSPPA